MLKVKKGKLKIYTLIGIAFLVGFIILNQQKTKTPISVTSSASPSVEKSPVPDNLTEDERFMLNPPPADASRSALNKHAQIVAKIATNGDILEIKNCQPNPLVLKIKQDSNFTIKNTDNNEYKITFDEEHVYKIPANDSQTIKANFKYGTGDYGYICEGVGIVKLVGFLHIIP